MTPLLLSWSTRACCDSGERVAARVTVPKSSSSSPRASSHGLSSVVHELRTPLNAILAWVQILSPDVGRSVLERGLRSIKRAARRQARVLEDVSVMGGVTLDDDETDDAGGLLPSLDGARVLLLDDDESSREATARVVSSAGALGWHVATGPEAVDLLERRHFDVIVSDITMDGMDGIDFMRAVRAHPTFHVRTTPAIALSAVTSLAARRRAYCAGFQTFIAKPVDRVELCAAIGNLRQLHSSYKTGEA